MAARCKRCNGRSVVHDRSLGGRLICATCGTPVNAANNQGSRQSNYSTKATSGSSRNGLSLKTAIAWLLPISLIGGHLYLTSNPRAVSHWLAPYSPTSKNSWWIKTPADAELLIHQAQKAENKSSEQSTQKSIRDLISRLQAKGVRILVSERVMEHAGGEWDPGMAEVRIRPSTVMMGSDALVEVLAHEAAHVAQSCRAGGLGKNSEPMGIEVDPAEAFSKQLDSPLYKGTPASKAVELEAFTVGTNPAWAIQLLDQFCKG